MMAAKDDDPKVVPLKPGPDPAIAGLLDLRDTGGLRLNDRRKPIACLENVVTILLKSEHWQKVLAYNEFALATEKKTAPPFDQPAVGEWTDADDDELDLWLSKHHDLRVGKETCGRAVGIVARRNGYHPVRDYLNALAWDGTGRLGTWLYDYLGAQIPDEDLRTITYYAKAGAWWLISAVARVFRPGCKADHVLLLEGRQGIGKSLALQILFDEWHSDTPLRIGDKDSYGALRGVWGYELSELDSLNRAETSASKAFFTSARDKYRPPYGKRDIQALRQVVFAGTVNHDQYLRDSTGNRRYWPVRCGPDLKLRGAESLEAMRDQLFAEACVHFHDGTLWYPSRAEEVELFGQQQSQREVGDVYEALIEQGTLGRTEITMVEIFTTILDTEPAKMTKPEQMRIGEAMKRLGWAKVRESAGKRTYKYEREVDESAPAKPADNPGVPF
jgi:predicted P-loop ATPase